MTDELLYALGKVYVKREDGSIEFVGTTVTPEEPTFAVEMEAAGMRQMWDAAYPPSSPPNVEAVAGYIGGSTPNIWTEQEWTDSLRRSSAQFKLPIFVRVPPTSHDPKDDAAFCIAWARNHNQPKGSIIALDYETAVDATYLRAFDAVIIAGGYKTMVYGSRSFVFQNPKPSGGYWSATWNNVPHLDAGAAATQYGGDVTLGQPWDINVVADSCPLWAMEEDMPLTTDEIEAIVDRWQAKYGMRLAQWNAGKTNTVYNTAAVGVAAPYSSVDMDELKALVQQGGVSAEAIANALAPLVGPAVAAELAKLTLKAVPNQ